MVSHSDMVVSNAGLIHAEWFPQSYSYRDYDDDSIPQGWKVQPFGFGEAFPPFDIAGARVANKQLQQRCSPRLEKTMKCRHIPAPFTKSDPHFQAHDVVSSEPPAAHRTKKKKNNKKT